MPELGDDLLAVWLYGSRARGEADPDETDPDRRSRCRPADDRRSFFTQEVDRDKLILSGGRLDELGREERGGV